MSESPSAKRARVVSSQFRRAVREYIVCEDTLERIKLQNKDVKSRRNELREQIQEYMVRNDIPRCRLAETGDKLVVKRQTKKQKVTKKDINEAISNLVTQEQKDKISLTLEREKSQLSPIVSFSLAREREMPFSQVSINAASDSEAGM